MACLREAQLRAPDAPHMTALPQPLPCRKLFAKSIQSVYNSFIGQKQDRSTTIRTTCTTEP